MFLGTMDRYLASAVLKATVAVLACLATLVTLFTAADELRDGTPGYDAGLALLYVLYSTPRRLCDMAPYGVFVGALAGLGTLAERGEITILRAAGVSVRRLFASVAAPALLVLLGSQALGEFVAPRGEALAATLKLKLLRGAGGDAIASQYWHREGDLYTNVDGYGADGSLLGIRQFQLDEGRLRLSRQAAQATYESGAGSGKGRWLLHDVAETTFPAETRLPTEWLSAEPQLPAKPFSLVPEPHWNDGPDRRPCHQPIRHCNRVDPLAGPRESAPASMASTETRRYETLPWRTAADPRLLSAKALFDPAKLSFADLRFQIDYLRREGLDATRYQVSFWRKALEPAAVLGLVLLALGCVLGPLREAGMGARLAAGVAAGLAYKYLLDLFAPMSSVFGLPPLVGMAVPVAACWMAGWALARRL